MPHLNLDGTTAVFEEKDGTVTLIPAAAVDRIVIRDGEITIHTGNFSAVLDGHTLSVPDAVATCRAFLERR